MCIHLTSAPFIEVEHEESILMSKKKCDVEKQVKVGCFFTGTIHSDLKTTRKTVEPMSHRKKGWVALPQEGSEASHTDHQWDLGSYLCLGFRETTLPRESLNKESHIRRLWGIHFLLARF